MEKSRRKSFLLTVDRAGVPLVRAPLSASAEEIARFVEKHRLWLKRRLAERENVPKSDLRDGSVVALFGREYRIVSGRTALGEGILSLPAEGREEAFVRLLKRHAAAAMGRFTAELAARYGFSYSSVRITSARRRWGSCSAKGALSYTFRIALVPLPAAYYVAVHELCHTRHLDHSPAFWREVEAVFPDWKSARKILRGCTYLMDRY